MSNMTFNEKIELADAFEMDGYMYQIAYIKGDTVHYADCYDSYSATKAELQSNNARLFIEMTDKEAA